jgi:hypothetical protein
MNNSAYGYISVEDLNFFSAPNQPEIMAEAILELGYVHSKHGALLSIRVIL